MTNFTRSNYIDAIDKNQIEKFSNIDSKVGEGVKKIQEIKEDIISGIYSIGKIDSRGIKDLEKLYLSALEELEGIEFDGKNDYINSSRKDIEGMFKQQTENFLAERKGYIGDFDSFILLLNKYIGINKRDLYKSLSDRFVSNKDKSEIKKYLSIMNIDLIEKTRKRDLNFDDDIFKSNLLDDNYKNIECFYEIDFNGNKNYFSINTLLNYIDTFGFEIGLFELDIESIPNNIKNKYFPSINKKIKVSMYKTIIQELRDKQEILMYGFKDYEITDGSNKEKQSGFIAEKVIELEFRELSKLSDYKISISRGSVGEDQQNKIDLFIILEDQKTGITIKDELQITLKTDLSLKNRQIKKRNKILQEQGEYTESKLINFTLKDLGQKSHVWKYYNRPIGKLSDTLDDIEKSTIREIFKRLVEKLEQKKEKLS